MEPNKFRESRQAINRMCEHIDLLIEKKAVEESKTSFEEVNSELENLRPQAEGEIQERSVKNLGMKLNILAGRISKLKEKKATRQRSSGGKQNIQWDENRVGQLAEAFLVKLTDNMAGDKEAKVFFGTTGKGIRPNYRIEFGDGRVVGFTGSGHKPQDPLPATGAGNLSDPFPFEVIQSILENK
ncbi:MAG: hypothetical protein HUN04_05195 [Desulfobacter sp.]|nr:MAG: hypothetical protein HUN04_05195 [Desulfobacter sp.]